MRATSLKLPEALDRRLTLLAKRRKTTRSALLREAIEAFAAGEKGSFAARAGDLVRAWDAPKDLSKNPKHMAGYGR